MLAIMRILEAVSKGNFELSLHAQKQMTDRNIQVEDIINCAKTVTKSVFQEKKGTYKIVGYSIESKRMTIVCAEFNGVLIVTVYPLGEKRK